MFKARETTVRQLFGEEHDQFIIPHYQRSYVWGMDELENFWNDFIIRDEGQGQLHLLGTVIISKSKNQPRIFGVVDGQQRIITCSLFIAALRDFWGKEFGYTENDYYNLDRFVQKTDRSKGTVVRVKVADTISELYDNIVVAKTKEGATTVSADQKSIIRAYDFFYQKILDSYSMPNVNQKQKQDLLWKKIDNLFDSSLVMVILEDEDDAYEVFEGFNARGVELSISDLFKNLFLQKISGPDEDKQKALEKWNEINTIVSELGVSRFNINTLLRYYWIRNHSFVGEKQLYKRIKKETRDYSALLNDIYAIALSMRTLFSDNPYEIKELFKECRIEYASSIAASLRALKVMNTQSYLVWLMTLVDKSNRDFVIPKLMAKSLKHIENFSFRYFAVSKLPSNRIEKLYSNISRDLFLLVERHESQRINSYISDKFKLTIESESLLPLSDQFMQDFQEISLKANNKGLIRYILSVFEQSYGSGEKMIDQTTVNIEHILPQKPGLEWNINSSELKQNVNRLGNLTILLGTLNSSMSNKPIMAKIQYLAKSDLTLNKDIVKIVEQVGAWGVSEIGQREKILAKRANEIWNLD